VFLSYIKIHYQQSFWRLLLAQESVHGSTVTMAVGDLKVKDVVVSLSMSSTEDAAPVRKKAARANMTDAEVLKALGELLRICSKNIP
jgi:hypothetical protein